VSFIFVVNAVKEKNTYKQLRNSANELGQTETEREREE